MKFTICFLTSLILSINLDSSISSVHALSIENSSKYNKHVTKSKSSPCIITQNRRSMLSSVAMAGFGLLSQAEPSIAFDNKISNKYDDRPKRRGPQPKDLGISVRKNMDGEEYQGLKQCGAAPNCFCSTDMDDPDHLIPAWRWPDGLSKKDAFMQLEKTIRAYEPGQKNIDGGGFNVVKVDLDNGYIYAQFESLKNGYIDDLEIAYLDGYGKSNEIQVRSSSRIGYLDFGVNGKRINYVAKALRSLGWVAEGVDPATHEFYVMENSRG